MSKQNHKVSCIVPAHNESSRIEYILHFLSSYSRIDEVVVVNDGSSDDTAKVIEQFINEFGQAKFKFLNKKKNEGKGAAIKDGLDLVTGEIVIMSDADIFRINNKCFDVLIDNLDNQTRMVVLDTSFIRKFVLSITGMTRLWSGQRSFFTKELRQIDWDKAKGYALESSINDQYISNNWRSKYVFAFGAESALQFEKKGGSKNGTAFYVQITKEIFGNYSVSRLVWHRINSPINAIRFAYFLYLPPLMRVLLAPLTLSAESIYGFYLSIFVNIAYLLESLNFNIFSSEDNRTEPNQSNSQE